MILKILKLDPGCPWNSWDPNPCIGKLMWKRPDNSYWFILEEDESELNEGMGILLGDDPVRDPGFKTEIIEL